MAGRDVYYDGLARKVSLEKYRNEFSKISEETGIFESMGIWDQLEKLIEGKVQLYKGSYLIFEQTSAFLNIDLNSGNNLKFKKNDINLNACDEIFRVITLCGFGGKILIDFLPSSGEARKEIYKKMSLCFSGDTVKNKIWGWTKSGIFELERKRDKIPLKLLIANN